MKKKERQSGIELLRIIAMLQIIYLHLYQYGGLRAGSANAGDLDRFATLFIWSFCRAPVDIFIMITGYFMITAKFDIKK
ncbi:MAG: acyltransferase, partial [Clostridia bacterium]|nr:acyltransferase [Clostridia bacterium]